jgi:hypothetical protein
MISKLLGVSTTFPINHSFKLDLWSQGWFGVVTVVGFNPAKAQVGDIAVKITHNGCVSRVKVWVKSQWSKQLVVVATVPLHLI